MVILKGSSYLKTYQQLMYLLLISFINVREGQIDCGRESIR